MLRVPASYKIPVMLLIKPSQATRTPSNPGAHEVLTVPASCKIPVVTHVTKAIYPSTG